jgi:predicted membrane protein
MEAFMPVMLAIMFLTVILFSIGFVGSLFGAEGKQKTKFKDNPKTVTSTMTITADWIIVKSSPPASGMGEDVTISEGGPEIIGTLKQDGTFEGNIIKSIKSLIGQILQLRNENQALKNEIEGWKEDFYTLRKLYKEKNK